MGVYSHEDGTCCVSSAVEGDIFAPPAGTRALSKLPLIWHWNALHVVEMKEVRRLRYEKTAFAYLHVQSHLIFVCASSEATTSAMQPSESDDDRTEEARVVAFELQAERGGDPASLVLMKIGDWSFDGPVGSIALHKDSDGK